MVLAAMLVAEIAVQKVAELDSLQSSLSLILSLSKGATMVLQPPIFKKLCQLIQHHPNSLILMVSFPAGMLRKPSEVRKGSVISPAGLLTLQGKRFYLTRVKPVIGTGDPVIFLAQTGKYPGNA